MKDNVDVAKRGGAVAKTARKGYEKTIGESVVSTLNAEDKAALERMTDAPKGE